MTCGSHIKRVPSPTPVHPCRVFGAAGAECVYDPELHTGPTEAESPAERAARQEVARQVCAACPLLPQCLAYARTCAPTFGVWAGRTAQELTAPAPGELAEVA
ncbi:hypothetical protein GCM10017673_05030 [Streptosporangium violaceochromogenes]|nr:hypothetical protein GCM10017673_05030 [Streptosporangium violaceochromogenes]